MKEVLAGAMITMYVVAGLFFLKFWRRTGDALFGFFAVAFGLLAAQYLGLTVTEQGFERSTWFYVTRLLAFLLILAGIWSKNRRAR